MSVIYIGGVPGSGKTLFTTWLMIRKYKQENFLSRFRTKKRYINIFSNYPIRLDKKHYSFNITLNDLNNYTKHLPDCDIVFDEFQSYFDSLDYKNFPRRISKNFQFHRHFGIHNIYVISQHPSRVVKQARILVNEFYQITKFIKIPFIGIGIFIYNIYYNFEDYGLSVKVKKDSVNYDFKRKIRFIFYRKVFKSYDTKYLRALVDDKPYLDNISYTGTNLSTGDINRNFNMK